MIHEHVFDYYIQTALLRTRAGQLWTWRGIRGSLGPDGRLEDDL